MNSEIRHYAIDFLCALQIETSFIEKICCEVNYDEMTDVFNEKKKNLAKKQNMFFSIIFSFLFFTGKKLNHPFRRLFMFFYGIFFF